MERRRFTREFKLEAVKLIRERGVSVAQASRDLDVQGTVLRNWVKAFADDPQHAFPGHGQLKPEQAEIARLKHEVTKLKAERDILLLWWWVLRRRAVLPVLSELRVSELRATKLVLRQPAWILSVRRAVLRSLAAVATVLRSHSVGRRHSQTVTLRQRSAPSRVRPQT